MNDAYVPRRNPNGSPLLIKDFWEKENRGKLIIGTSCFGDYLSSLSQEHLDRLGKLLEKCEEKNCDPETSDEVVCLMICLLYLETGKSVSLNTVDEKISIFSVVINMETLRRKGLISIDLSWDIMRISDKDFGGSSCTTTDLGTEVAEKMFGKKKQ